MSKALKTIGKIAGTVAAVTAFIPGLQPIAAVASAIATPSSIGCSVPTRRAK